MPSPGHYTETTSLEFILNPFKLFFTAYVVHVTTNLEMPARSPTIYARALSCSRCASCSHLRIRCRCHIGRHVYASVTTFRDRVQRRKNAALRASCVPIKGAREPVTCRCAPPRFVPAPALRLSGLTAGANERLSDFCGCAPRGNPRRALVRSVSVSQLPRRALRVSESRAAHLPASRRSRPRVVRTAGRRRCSRRAPAERRMRR